jgi:signal transduction histidine kinase
LLKITRVPILFKILKLKTCLFLLSVLMSIPGLPQADRKIDSLRSRLSQRTGSDRFEILYDLVFEYLAKEDFQQSLIYIKEAKEIAYQAGDSLRIVKTGRVTGQILQRLDRAADAIVEFQEIRPISKRNTSVKEYVKEYESILNALAVSYSYQANYDKALQYHFECLVLLEKEGNLEDIAITLNNIGFVYYKLNNFEKALKSYRRILDNSYPINFKDVLFINIGLCYNGLNDFSTAKKFIDDGLKVCASNCNVVTIIQGKFGLGVSLFYLHKPKEAEGNFLVSYELAKKQKDKRFQIENLIYLARIDNGQGQFDAARKFLTDAESIADKTDYNALMIDIYRLYSELFTKTKDYENAAIYQHKYIILKDSIYSQELMKNLTRVQTNFEERENIKTIKDQDAVLALKEETLKRQTAENRFYVVIAIMVFALAALMLVLFRLTRRANERLESRVDERTKELNDSNDALKKVNGEMDNFIYKTSHDIRGPLASLKGICNVAIMDVNDTTALGYLKKLDNTAEKLNLILTRLLIINQVNHAVLAANVINFEEVIEDILFIERKKGIPKRMTITYEVAKGVVMKSDREMLRIVMENLIDNSIKFYNESDRIDPFVKIHITAMARYVIITVTDNGVGINDETKEKIFQMFVRASERSETGGIGLYLAKLATGRLEGTIDFSTTPEKFTEFTVRLPLDLGPVLEFRNEQERILEFEKRKLSEKQRGAAVS